MFENLYDDIGGKIKGWAKWIFLIESIAAVIAGIVLILGAPDYAFLGLLTIFFGPLIAYVSTWILYGFGELIDISDESRLYLKYLAEGEEAKRKKDIESNVNQNTSHHLSNKNRVTGPIKTAQSPANTYWVCSCGQENTPKSMICANCFSPKQ